MYKQTLYEIVVPIKRTTVSRMNKGKKWKYGYDKEHDVIIISKTGQIGEIYKIQDLKIALPKSTNVFKHKDNKWVKLEQPKELNKYKNIFDYHLNPSKDLLLKQKLVLLLVILHHLLA